MNNSEELWRELSLGFIGGGLSSTIGRVHYTASQLDGNWKVVAGAFSRDGDINRQTAKRWNVPEERLYSDWEMLITSERGHIDAVVVLTPTPNHSVVVQRLLEEGIPVICEKPLAASVEDAYVLKDKLSCNREFLAVTFNYTGYPLVRELREQINAGVLGDIQLIDFEMPQDAFTHMHLDASNEQTPKKWRLVDNFVPTICLDLGVHLHALSSFLIGEEPLRTFAQFSNFSGALGLVDDVMMLLEYESGVKGKFWMSKSAIGFHNGLRLRVFGNRGSAEWLQTNPEELILCGQNGTKEILDRGSKACICDHRRYNRYKPGHPAGFIEAFANVYADIADEVLKKETRAGQPNPYVMGLDVSIKGIELFAAARRSTKTYTWESVG